jgi:hypothetical protein
MKYLIAATLVCAAAAYAEDVCAISFVPTQVCYTINASQIVTGTFETANWNLPAAQPAGTDFSTLSSIWHNQLPLVYLGFFDFYRPTYYMGAGWAPPSTPTAPQPYTGGLGLPTHTVTTNNLITTYSNPYVVRAEVDFSNPDGVTAMVSNGWAYADFNYRVYALNSSGSAKDYYLYFPNVKTNRSVQVPFSLSSPSDPGGGTYSYVNPPWALSASSADVYVDGLPVYSSASVFDHPPTSTDAFQKLETTFGTTVTNPFILIYLGKIPSGNSVTADLVIHAEANADSPKCGTQYFSNYYDPPPTLQNNCLSLIESIPIPAVSGNVKFEVLSN